MQPGRFEKDGNILIIDEVYKDEVFYREWVDGEFNGAWRKDRDMFEALFKLWFG